MHIRSLVPWGIALALGATAAPPAQAEDVRLAFVDLRKAMFNCKEGRTAQEQFAKFEEQKLEELRPRREELRSLEEEYEKQRFVLSPEALQDRRLDIVKKRRDLERDLREAEDELQIRQVQLLQPIQKRIAEVVKELGEERGYTMIVDKSTQGLLYFEDGLDVTDAVIAELNK